MRLQQFLGASTIPDPTEFLEYVQLLQLLRRKVGSFQCEVRDPQCLISLIELSIVALRFFEVTDRGLVIFLTLKGNTKQVIRFGVARYLLQDRPKLFLGPLTFTLGKKADAIAVSLGQLRGAGGHHLATATASVESAASESGLRTGQETDDDQHQATHDPHIKDQCA